MANVQTAGNLTVTSASAWIRDTLNADISVGGLARLSAATTITLGDNGATDTTNFGSLELTSGGAATITESSSTVLVGADVGMLALVSANDIVTQDGVVTAVGPITFTAGGDVTVRKILGLPLSESEIVASEITIDAGGVIMIEDEAVLKSTHGRVTNAPPLLIVDEANPGKTIVPGDRVQELAGTIGTNLSPDDNFELGADFIITVTWDDGQVSVIDMANLPGGVPLTAGDRIEMHVGENVSQYTLTRTPGNGTGPVEYLITREYPILHLVNVSLEVVTTLEVSNDPGIALKDSRTVDLNNVDDTVATNVAGDEFRLFGLALEFLRPEVIVVETTRIVFIETQTIPPLQTNRLEELRPVSDTMVEQDRKLLLVKVGADGAEIEWEPLPGDALLDLKGLFETLIEKGLPNGLYRIYLSEPGFPLRKLIEFYKSDTTIGEPVREQPRGSNPTGEDGVFAAPPENVIVSASADTEMWRAAEVSTAASEEAFVPRGGERTGTDAEAGRSLPQAPGIESSDGTETRPAEDEFTGAWTLMGRLRRPLAGAVMLAGGVAACSSGERWEESIDRVMEDSEARSFTKAARLGRRFRRAVCR